MKIHAGLATGWYRLHSRDGSEYTIVYLYTNPDTMIRGFGFNIKDGGGFLPVNDVGKDCWVEPLNL